MLLSSCTAVGSAARGASAPTEGEGRGISAARLQLVLITASKIAQCLLRKSFEVK